MTHSITRFQKAEISLRYWLDGRRYYLALRAMEFAKRYHQGTRKDDVTPEFYHQVEIANFVRTFDHVLLHPEATFCAVLLHDVREDYGVTDAQIREPFGALVADAVERLTKKTRGIVKPKDLYFAELGTCAIGSVAKGADRIANLNSMEGVFGAEKQLDYAAEAEDRFLPMLKAGRALFPEQRPVYQNMQYVIRGQVSLVRAIHRAENAA